MRHQPFLRPPRITVPISPKLGRNPEVRVVRPMIPFIPKKSTKELTQPVGFRFTTDDRLEIRRAHYDADAEDKERKVIEARMARQQALDQKLATRERFESTFRARPIAHYPPIHIRPAKKALTVPVSPLIGDKRKRYEAALRFAAAQDTGGDEVEYSDGMFQRDYRGAGEQIENSETYRQFEEGRLMQEQQESLKRQLKDQEIRQLELANSSHANVQQPPLRISFPFDPETQAIQQEDNVVVDISIEDLHTEEYQEEEEQQQQQQQQQQQFRIGRTLPTSQAARRTSSGIGNKRVSLTTSKVIESGSPRRMSGRARRTSRESSPEHDHNTPSKASVYEPYYAFSRSMERTADLETAKDKTVVGAAVPRAEESSAENDSHGKGDRSTPPADVDRSSLEQRNQRPDTATVLESTAAVDDFLVADGLPKQQPEDNDPDRRRSGSFFPLDRDTRPALPNTTGATASRRISMGVNDDPDRRRSGSFIPLLEATTATKTNVQDKGKKKEATLATALKAKQPVSALITGAAQRHRLPIPSNPMRGRILPGTLGV
ncbi:hypothetical protein BGZ73_002816 [Actinomortierella ambigua]|nr:hypothetical protein BGZ73_002816 [Actinomortierella ambigua]